MKSEKNILSIGIMEQHAGDPKRLIIFEGGDHRMTDPGHPETFAGKSIEWFRQQVSIVAAEHGGCRGEGCGAWIIR